MASEQTVMAVIRAARPNFRNAQDKLAFAVHASFLASGYVTHAVGPAAFPADSLSSVSTEGEVGIDNWNQIEDEYAFIYSNPSQGPKKVLVKCLNMNDQLHVSAVSDDRSEPVHLEIRVEDYDRTDGGNNYGSQYKDLQKLLSSVDKELLTKLGTPSARSAVHPSSSTEPSRSERRDIEVTERPQSEPYTPSFVFPPVYSVGARDLYPAWMFPSSDVDTGDGMLVGPDHPIFSGRFGGGVGMFVGPDHPIFSGRFGGGVGIGRHPNFGDLQGVPPGAHFDPYGPPGVPGFEPNRFTRGPRRPGGGTHLDLEHFRDGSDFI